MTQVIGFAAATFTALAFLPQVLKAWRTRSLGDVSTAMLVFQGSGVTLWLFYGAAIRSAPVIASNAVTLALVLLLAYFKAKFEMTHAPA